MQTAATMTATGEVAVKETIAGIFTQTIRTSGLMGLYKGVSAPLVAVTPLFAVSFWSYDMGQRLVCYVKSTATTQLTLTDKCIAGGLSAIPTAALMIPSERIKVLMQTAAPGQYRGMVDCASQLYRTGGIQSIFRGTGLTLLRDIPGSVAWFGMYEAENRHDASTGFDRYIETKSHCGVECRWIGWYCLLDCTNPVRHFEIKISKCPRWDLSRWGTRCPQTFDS